MNKPANNNFGSAQDSGYLLEVRKLKKSFPVQSGFWNRKSGEVKAVDEVSFAIQKGETLGIVGESGCGKTTVGRSLIRLIEPTAGEVFFWGENILKFDDSAMRTIRRKIQIVFQDPYSSLNPRKTIGSMLREILSFHKIVPGNKINERINELLDVVGLSRDYIERYPHEFSGGQRQRIGILRALAVEPEFIVLDEPVSALDVSIQAQILNLLKDLQKRFNLSYLFISHSLSVVEHISDQVAVMYLGRIVEMGSTADVVSSPKHPYTQALISAAPRPDPLSRIVKIPLQGDVPNPANPPTGCHFHPRCPVALEGCSTWAYEFKIDSANRKVACVRS